MTIFDSQTIIAIELNSIVSLLGENTGDYASYSISAAFAQASLGYIQLDQAASRLTIGPFIEEEIAGNDVVEVFINLRDG